MLMELKQVYVNEKLRSLPVGTPPRLPAPREWIFSCGEKWLLLTPPRLRALAARLGLEDTRIARILTDVRRWHPHPERFCRLLGLEETPQTLSRNYAPVSCPGCGHVHCPHPLEAENPCPECAALGATRRARAAARGRDRALNTEARAHLREVSPGDFEDGVLRPNWRMNKLRRLHRDWDNAINRILLGDHYRPVAREYDCSVGLLHKKVAEAKYWEWN